MARDHDPETCETCALRRELAEREKDRTVKTRLDHGLRGGIDLDTLSEPGVYCFGLEAVQMNDGNWYVDARKEDEG